MLPMTIKCLPHFVKMNMRAMERILWHSPWFNMTNMRICNTNSGKCRWSLGRDIQNHANCDRVWKSPDLALLPLQFESHLAISRDIVDTTVNHYRVHFFLRNSLLPPVVTIIPSTFHGFKLRRRDGAHDPEVLGPVLWGSHCWHQCRHCKIWPNGSLLSLRLRQAPSCSKFVLISGTSIPFNDLIKTNFRSGGVRTTGSLGSV